MFRVKFAEDGVVELASIISLKCANWTAELRRGVGMERHYVFGNIRLVTERECPDKVCVVI